MYTIVRFLLFEEVCNPSLCKEFIEWLASKWRVQHNWVRICLMRLMGISKKNTFVV